MSVTDELVRNAQAYAERFDGGLPLAPAKGVAVVACMDARLIPTRVLGLEEGDAHVIRNAGGVVTDDVIRSLTISQRVLGTREVVLLHHTDCGMLRLSEDGFRAQLLEETGLKPTWAVEAFSELDDDLRHSMTRLRTSPFLPHTSAVRGFVFDVHTGALREVQEQG